jgi:hypothetical protein
VSADPEIEARREANRTKQRVWYARNGKAKMRERGRAEKALTILCQNHHIEYRAHRAGQDQTDAPQATKNRRARRAIRDKYPDELAAILASLPTVEAP